MLCSMVEQDEKQSSIDFIENLASYYRSMIRRRNTRRISIDDELATMNDYISIVSKHYGPQLEVKVIKDNSQSHFCVPFSLQLLVENALKHNVISKESPMCITVAIDKEGITVTNSHTPKPVTDRRTGGLGLSYLRNMYSEFGHSVRIDNEGGIFRVTLPATI
ncbi:MAG: histidine kinase, partial [Muribaculaceae bacterium]|nr:histidine kinase [Muribaculaceae bacterium]